MKTSIFGTVALALCATATPTKRATSKSWAGTSCYFLQGMSADDQQSYLSSLAGFGVKVIRLWVASQPGGNSCVKGTTSVSSVGDLETTIGSYNDDTLDLLDQTLVYAGNAGIKAIISPHDGNVLNGPNGNDIYGQTYGAGDFYSEDDAIAAYDARLTHILSYKGAHSGRVWGTWDDVIMAFDLQNEPFSSDPSKCTLSSAGPWACGRAGTMKGLIGDSNVKVATGGFGGDISHDCTFISGAMSCDDIDIVSVHRYAGPEGSNEGQWSGAYPGWISSADNKLVHVEEWGVQVNSYDPTTEFPANTADMNSAGLPWMYWQLLPHQTCSSNDQDGFGFPIDSGVDIKTQVTDANNAESAQDWSGIAV